MKILYNIAAISNSGGMERVLANKSNWLSNNGYEVIIVTTDQKGKPAFFPMNEGIRLYDLGINYSDNGVDYFLKRLVRYLLKQIRHRSRLKALIDEIKPDIVVSMFGNEALLIAGMHIKAPKVIEFHFCKMMYILYGRGGLWHFFDLFRTKLDAYIAKKYDRFVVLTKEDAIDWGSGYSNISVIPNALSSFPDRISSLDKKTVVAIGRLSGQKGFERLIPIWAKVAPKMPDWKLEIIGGGDTEYKSYLQTMADNAGVHDSLLFLPPVKNMDEIYMNASVFVMTSKYEGLSMVLLESQSYGIPAVSFACKCGPRDIIENGVNGFLVEDGDVGLFASRLETLMRDAKLRKSMGAKAREKSTRFSEESIMSQWDVLFKDLANTNNG